MKMRIKVHASTNDKLTKKYFKLYGVRSRRTHLFRDQLWLAEADARGWKLAK